MRRRPQEAASDQVAERVSKTVGEGCLEKGGTVGPVLVSGRDRRRSRFPLGHPLCSGRL